MGSKKMGTPASVPGQKIHDISSVDNIGKKSIVCYRREGDPAEYILNGRLAQTLFNLVKHGRKGISALTMGGWAIRLASYIFALKNKHGLTIIERDIPQPDGTGTYGQYFLQTPVKIVWLINRGATPV